MLTKQNVKVYWYDVTFRCFNYYVVCYLSFFSSYSCTAAVQTLVLTHYKDL